MGDSTQNHLALGLGSAAAAPAAIAAGASGAVLTGMGVKDLVEAANRAFGNTVLLSENASSGDSASTSKQSSSIGSSSTITDDIRASGTGEQADKTPYDILNASPTAADIDEYIARLPSKPTMTSSNDGLFEVEQTGPLNYRVSGGGTAIDVDGYQGSTLQEAKYVEEASKSPYVDGSKVPVFLRQKILSQQDYEFQHYQATIGDPAVPFDTLDVLTNEPAAVPYFQRLLDSYGLPGQVKVVETKIPRMGVKLP